MMTSKKSFREGYHTVTPYLTVSDAASAIEFYKQAFGATEIHRIVGEDGKIGFAALQIGDSRLMISDEFPEIGVRGPRSLGGSSVGIHLFVEDVDAWADRAIAAGAKVLRPVADQGTDLRNGIFQCPFGHRWFIASAL